MKKGTNGSTAEPKSNCHEFPKWNKDLFSEWTPNKPIY